MQDDKRCFIRDWSFACGCASGVSIGPLMFLIFINDITDEIVGLGRLFADNCTSLRCRRYVVISVVGEMYRYRCCRRDVQFSVLLKRCTVISVVVKMYSYQSVHFSYNTDNCASLLQY
jgi:hypothetical protein